MKQKFYLIEDLKVFINLDHLVSFKIEYPSSNLKGIVKEKCCIVVGNNTIYWCDVENYYNLISLIS